VDGTARQQGIGDSRPMEEGRCRAIALMRSPRGAVAIAGGLEVPLADRCKGVQAARAPDGRGLRALTGTGMGSVSLCCALERVTAFCRKPLTIDKKCRAQAASTTPQE